MPIPDESPVSGQERRELITPSFQSSALKSEGIHGSTEIGSSLYSGKWSWCDQSIFTIRSYNVFQKVPKFIRKDRRSA